MRTFRFLILLLMLLCLVPPLSLLTAALAARWVGCDLDLPPVTPVPCTILGGDYGNILFALADFGWYTIETIPVLIALLAGWLIVEIVRGLGQTAKPRQQKAASISWKKRQPSVPAASRNRERGS